MIYLFGKGRNLSIIYRPETLSEKDKQGGIAIEKLPPKSVIKGHNAILALDENNKPYWIYEPIKVEELEVVEEIEPE
jgi:hypothetical protein